MEEQQKPNVENLEEMLNYLDGLRLSGVTNMFGAGSYVQKEFGAGKRTARSVVVYWMGTFAERQES